MKKNELKEYLMRDAENMRALNFGETYIRDVVSNTERWGQTGLLQALDDPYIGRQVARLLENQRQQNEDANGTYQPPKNAQTNWNEPQWRRVSIPAIRRVFGAFVPYHLVSVQAMSGPEDRLHYTGLDERQNSLLIQAKTRQMGRDWWQGGEMLGESGQHSIDLEAQALASFSQRYANDVANEVIRDLINNCGSNANAEYADQNQLMSLVEGMSAYIAAKIHGREATWIVASPVVTELLRPTVKEWQEDDDLHKDEMGKEFYKWSVKYRGLVNDKWKLYESPFHPTDKILLGHKDNQNHYFSGYFYCPYRPFTQQPGWWKEDGTHQHTTLYSRYSKKLIEANFYGLISLSNLPQEVKAEENNESEA